MHLMQVPHAGQGSGGSQRDGWMNVPEASNTLKKSFLKMPHIL